MRCVLGLMLCMLWTVAAAGEAAPTADDPILEQRLMTLAKELRCLVCQNESLADSRADLAADLRQQIREQMRAGRTDEEIKRWLTQRYGDFVLYRTPVKASTMLLWFGPFALLLAGLAVLFFYLGRRRARIGQHALTPQDQARALSLLHEVEAHAERSADARTRH